MEKTYFKPMTDDEFEKLMKEHDKGGAFKKSVVASQSCWDSGIKIIKNCGHMDIPKFHVKFKQLADEKIKKLQSYYSCLEWLAYLEGEIDRENKIVTVEDLVIPDSQQVTGVNVYNVEYSWNQGRKIIGVIHSHHNMGAFFSGTDDAYINQNHDVSIVVSTNQRSPIKGQVRVKTPCNSYVLAEDLTFTVERENILDEKEFENEFTNKINKYSPPVTYINRLFGGGRYSGYGTNYQNNMNINVRSNFVNTQEQQNLFEDPYDEEVDGMSKVEVRQQLRRYYSEEEVSDFFKEGEDFARDELATMLSLDDEYNETLSYKDDPKFMDEDEDEYVEGFHQIVSDFFKDEDEYVEGSHQISDGIPKKEDEDEDERYQHLN